MSIMERAMGIEPTTSAWKAEVLPLNYTRVHNAFLIVLPIFIGRSGRIRTCDPLLPRQVLYQTEPRPEYKGYYNCLPSKSQDLNVVTAQILLSSRVGQLLCKWQRHNRFLWKQA